MSEKNIVGKEFDEQIDHLVKSNKAAKALSFGADKFIGDLGNEITRTKQIGLIEEGRLGNFVLLNSTYLIGQQALANFLEDFTQGTLVGYNPYDILIGQIAKLRDENEEIISGKPNRLDQPIEQDIGPFHGKRRVISSILGYLSRPFRRRKN